MPKPLVVSVDISIASRDFSTEVLVSASKQVQEHEHAEPLCLLRVKRRPRT